MANLNKVFLIGRLTRDPELRYTPSGTAVCDLGLAVNREYSTSSGERKKDTLFIDVTVWQRQAEICAEYLSKGRTLFVEGRLSMDSWEQDGQKRTRYRVVAENFQFLGGRGEGGGPGGGGGGGRIASSSGPSYGESYRPPPPEEAESGGAGAGNGGQYPVSETDIPF